MNHYELDGFDENPKEPDDDIGDDPDLAFSPFRKLNN